MLIESTEHFHASAAIAIQRGPNEVTESEFARLPAATRTKLRILQEHGVVRLHAPEPPELEHSEPDGCAEPGEQS